MVNVVLTDGKCFFLHYHFLSPQCGLVRFGTDQNSWLHELFIVFVCCSDGRMSAKKSQVEEEKRVLSQFASVTEAVSMQDNAFEVRAPFSQRYIYQLTTLAGNPRKQTKKPEGNPYPFA